MPRRRKAKPGCDCLDCRDATLLAGLGADPTPPQPPLRCLTLFVDGLPLRSLQLLEQAGDSLTGLDQLVRAGCSGTLALLASGQSGLTFPHHSCRLTTNTLILLA